MPNYHVVQVRIMYIIKCGGFARLSFYIIIVNYTYVNCGWCLLLVPDLEKAYIPKLAFLHTLAILIFLSPFVT